MALVLAMALAILPGAGAAPVRAQGDESADWSDCSPDPGEPIECTWLEVPLRYDQPGDATVRLPVARLPARDAGARIGTLVTIAGGPGQRGTQLVRPELHAGAVAARFDIVSWDPRGTSGETDIDCIERWDPYEGLDRTPDTTVERTELDARTRELAEQCRDAHRDLLPYLGTHETVLDLERLRQLLGEPRISLMGLSYGSSVALAYAAKFPQRVRALVLDGVVDPWLSPSEREVEQAAAFERELDRSLAACAADASCPFRHDGRPGAALDDLLRRLDDAPLPAAGGRRLTQSDAFEAIGGSLVRDAGARARLLAALAAATAGDGTLLLDLATEVRRAYEGSGLDLGSFMAIQCADTAAYWRRATVTDLAALQQRMRHVAPRLGAWLWSPPADPDLSPPGLCAILPDPAPTHGSVPADAITSPVLALATSGDATTPIEVAERLVVRLPRATLVVLEADHHLAYFHAVAQPRRLDHRCLLDRVETFLDRPLGPTPTGACAHG